MNQANRASHVTDAVMAYLKRTEDRYDPTIHMLATELKSPGYHTTLGDGTIVHPTRDSLTYALALLKSEDPDLVRRGERVVAAVLELQDVDSTRGTYGIWPWFYEEPLTAMRPPDWNWADFCGALLATILHDHGSTLRAALSDAVRKALSHAAWSIFRRNVGPEYTNIAIMGSAVTLAAGEQLHIPHLVEYGRRRLANLVAHTKHHGDFNEYNSPTYTFTALDGIERILHLVRDREAREAAWWLHRHTWRIIADHFHPATGQLAGPHSRTYQDFLPSSRAEKLARLTGAVISPARSAEPHDDSPILVPEIPCPVEFIPNFRRLPQEAVVRRTRFIRGKSPSGDRIGTTWLSNGPSLASVNQECTWVQRRPLIAYWPAANDETAVFKVECLKNGRPFSSCMIRCDQDGPRVLAAFSLVSDLGDYHIYFGRPDDGVFWIKDLRFRFQLRGPATRCERLNETSYALIAGDWKAVVHTTDGFLGERPIEWTAVQDDRRTAIDAICHRGSEKPYDFRTCGPLVLAAGVEILPASKDVCPAPPRVVSRGDAFDAVWPEHSLTVSVPPQPEQYQNA